MKNQLKTLSLPLLLSSVILLTACSSGGGDSTPGGSSGGGGNTGVSFNGNTSPAAIDSSNAGNIGKAAGEAIQIANSSSGVPTAISIDTIDIGEINAIVFATAETAVLPSATDISTACTSGSAHMVLDPAEPASGQPVKMTITYSKCVTSGVTIDGSAIFNFNELGNPDAGLSVRYTDLKTTIDGKTTVINMTMECPSGYISCVYNSDFVGSDGVTHRVSEFSIYKSGSGYSGTARFYHGTYGRVSITATDITYGACGSYPDGGTVSFTSTSSSGSVTFSSDCSISGDWSNSSGSGTF